MLRFKLVEQVLHIMLNQDNPRSCVFFRLQIYVFFTLRYIRENGKYGKKVMQTFAQPSSQPSE